MASYSASTTESLALQMHTNKEICSCLPPFCKQNLLLFIQPRWQLSYVSAFYYILWAAVSAGYPALLSSSYFERINDDDDDEMKERLVII